MDNPADPGFRPGPAAEKPPAEIILVFSSNTEVLNAEDLLEAAGLDFELIPVPKTVNPNCGLALSVREEAVTAISLALNQAGLAAAAVYGRQGDEFTTLEGWPVNRGPLEATLEVPPSAGPIPKGLEFEPQAI